jgi:hypothetical protein
MVFASQFLGELLGGPDVAGLRPLVTSNEKKEDL